MPLAKEVIAFSLAYSECLKNFVPSCRKLLLCSAVRQPDHTCEHRGCASKYVAATGNLVTSPRYQHTATLLNNGKVLITRGLTYSTTTPPTISTLASAELYDPTTLAFAATSNMSAGRSAHTATLLNNGQILISGGAGTTGAELASVWELYDPTTGIFTATGSMSVGRAAHTATLLSNGKVLIAGGYDSVAFLRRAPNCTTRQPGSSRQLAASSYRSRISHGYPLEQWKSADRRRRKLHIRRTGQRRAIRPLYRNVSYG